MPRIKDQALKAELAKRGFESVSIKRALPGGRIQVEANKLYPVHVEAGESIYAPVPVSLSIELEARGRVKSIAGDTPTPAAVTDAARYIETLRDSGHLTSTGEQQSAGGVTHRASKKGRQIIWCSSPVASFPKSYIESGYEQHCLGTPNSGRSYARRAHASRSRPRSWMSPSVGSLLGEQGQQPADQCRLHARQHRTGA